MKLSPRQMRYISEVAQQGSIQKASRELRISQSSILAAINVAESMIDAKIFDRRPARGVLVTPEGKRFLAAARPFLAAEAEFSRSLGTIMGHSRLDNICVGCFEPFGAAYMIDVLKELQDRFGVGTIQIREGAQPQLREWLANGEIEAAVTYDIGGAFPGFTTRIGELPAHAALPIDHPLASRASVSLAELVEYPFVLLDLPETSVYLLTLFDVIARRPHIALRTSSFETVRAAVSKGLGFTILNTMSHRILNYDQDKIARIPLTDEVPAAKLVVVDLYGSRKPAYLHGLIETLSEYFGKQPKMARALAHA